MSKQSPKCVSALAVVDPQDGPTSIPALRDALQVVGGGEVIFVGGRGDGSGLAVIDAEAGLGELIGRAARRAGGELLLICQHGAAPQAEDLIEMVRRFDVPTPPPADEQGTPWAEPQQADMVVGRRPGRRRGIGAWLRDAAFGVPVGDVDCGLMLVARALATDIPLQSRSSFATVELAAKANFMGRMLDEVELAADPGGRPPSDGRQRRADARTLMRDPKFPACPPRAKPAPAPQAASSKPTKPAARQTPRRPRRPRGRKRK